MNIFLEIGEIVKIKGVQGGIDTIPPVKFFLEIPPVRTPIRQEKLRGEFLEF